jgi:hypothetical protein
MQRGAEIALTMQKDKENKHYTELMKYAIYNPKL